jgi:quercetin dioxygenase-like cupin family protein
MTEKAVQTIFVDNDRVRVSEWRFAPGAATGFHRHAYDYVVVPQTTGKLHMIGADGNEHDAALETGVPYFREEGVEHDVINRNAFEFVFVETEIK